MARRKDMEPLTAAKVQKESEEEHIQQLNRYTTRVIELIRQDLGMLINQEPNARIGVSKGLSTRQELLNRLLPYRPYGKFARYALNRLRKAQRALEDKSLNVHDPKGAVVHLNCALNHMLKLER